MHPLGIKTPQSLGPLPRPALHVFTTRLPTSLGTPTRLPRLDVPQPETLTDLLFWIPRLVIARPPPYLPLVFLRHSQLIPVKSLVKLQILTDPPIGRMVRTPCRRTILLLPQAYVLSLETAHVAAKLPGDAFGVLAAGGGAGGEGGGGGVGAEVAGALADEVFVGFPGRGFAGWNC